jgi:hypothetical protein
MTIDTTWIKNTGVEPLIPACATIDVSFRYLGAFIRVSPEFRLENPIDWSIDDVLGDVVEWRLSEVEELQE